MGSLVGHVAPGLIYFCYGLWHLLNNIMSYILHPHSYTSLSWYATSKIRHFELLLSAAATFTEIALEFVVGLEGRPFDRDGTIPFAHLHNLEHCLINFSFFAYAILALALDLLAWPNNKVRRAQHGLTFLLFAMALSQQVVLLHHHSVDTHAGPEGQYHMLLEILTIAAFVATLAATMVPKNFVAGFVRSLCVLFIGVWFVVIGVMLWTPRLVPKGCLMVVKKEGNQVVRCSGEEALHRANSLVNLQFGVLLVMVLSFGVLTFLVLLKVFAHRVEYFTLHMEFDEEKQQDGIEPNL